MARLFYRPSAVAVIEDYGKNNHFFHAPSNRHYRMVRRGNRFFQQRFQRDSRRNEPHRFEQEVTFIIGFGNHSDTYLNLSAGGTLTQLQVCSYAREGSCLLTAN